MINFYNIIILIGSIVIIMYLWKWYSYSKKIEPTTYSSTLVNGSRMQTQWWGYGWRPWWSYQGNPDFLIAS